MSEPRWRIVRSGGQVVVRGIRLRRSAEIIADTLRANNPHVDYEIVEVEDE